MKPYVYGRPIPEAIAGALMGFQITLALAFVRDSAYLVENMSIAPFVFAAGAALGGTVSWILAARSLPKMRAERVAMDETTAARRAA